MIKKILVLFTLCLFIIPAHARQVPTNRTSPFATTPEELATKETNKYQPQRPDHLPQQPTNYIEAIRFDSHAVEDTINTMVKPEYRIATAKAYETAMDSNGLISFTGLFKVCRAAGFYAKPNSLADGSKLCTEFVNIIAEKNGMGTNIDNETDCINRYNGRWVLLDGTNKYGCVGMDGHAVAYHSSCSNGDIDGCIRYFDPLYTQEPVARLFISKYGELNGLNLTCMPGHTQYNSIKCTSGGKAFEFLFRTLNATPGDIVNVSENKVMCTMFGGQLDEKSVTNEHEFFHKCTVSRDACREMGYFASSIGHSAYYDTGTCRLNKEPRTTSVIAIRQIDGVNSYEFADLDLRASEAQELVEKYLHRLFPDEEYIRCNPNTIVLDDVTISASHVMTCNVGTKTVDFVFDELSETWDFVKDASESKMECKIQGGRYDGYLCRNLTQEQCTELNNTVATKWDHGAGACLLRDAQDAKIIQDTVMVVGGVVVTVLTAGLAGAGTTATLVAVGGSVTVDYAFIGLERLQAEKPHHRALQFLSDTNGCKDKNCAYNIINSHFARLNEIFNDLNPNEMDTVLAEMERLGELLSDEELAQAMDASGLQLEDKVLNASSGILMAVALFAAPEDAIRRMATKAPKLFAKIVRIAPKLGQVLDNTNQLVKIANRYNKVTYKNISSTLNNQEYYRIMVNNGEDVSELVSDLQKNGFYVSANQTQSGQRFLGVSQENIFGPWNKSPYNWLLSKAKTGATLSKAQKLADAKRTGMWGYHGTDANIPDYDNIRWSKGSHPSGIFDGVSIAKQKTAAENYAINRLIKSQNPGLTNENFIYDQVTGVLTINSTAPINLKNRTFYIYELATDSNQWLDGLSNKYAGVFSAHYNKSQLGTEWLSKEAIDLFDFINTGRVRIHAPRLYY